VIHPGRPHKSTVTISSTKEAAMSQRVAGKVALVTGAGRGQGRSHALQLAEQGADIIALDICADIETNGYPLASVDDLDAVVKEIDALGRRAYRAVVDVRDRDGLILAVREGVDELGRLDIVVANAGICPLGPDRGVAAFVDAVQVDFVGLVNAVDAALPHLDAGASIIAIGSVAGLMPGTVDQPALGPGGAGYSWAKRACATFIHELALQLAPRSIRANVVHPTNCNTAMLQSDPMYRIYRPDLEHPKREDAEPAFYAMQTMPVPYVEPQDISNAVLFLASDESRYVTGLQMKVDAGATLRLPYPALAT
jgi:SDR family mycofactocin-dependent oxidoreductase